MSWDISQLFNFRSLLIGGCMLFANQTSLSHADCLERIFKVAEEGWPKPEAIEQAGNFCSRIDSAEQIDCLEKSYELADLSSKEGKPREGAHDRRTAFQNAASFCLALNVGAQTDCLERIFKVAEEGWPKPEAIEQAGNFCSRIDSAEQIDCVEKIYELADVPYNEGKPREGAHERRTAFHNTASFCLASHPVANGQE